VIILGNRIVVVGTQWGDEGKGKITDYLAQQADVVVRSQGGNNAGHTITFGGRKFALHLLPSGIFNPAILNVMANGMVIEPKAFFQELEMIHAAGIKDYRLIMSDRAHVIMPYHLELDVLEEGLKGALAVGTTKKGIGPAYTDKSMRIGIRIGDLLDPAQFKERLEIALKFANFKLIAYGSKPIDFNTLYEPYLAYGERLRPFIGDTSTVLEKAVDANQRILFEGAQGVMLCIDHGTYPYVTSSSPAASSVPLYAGIAPQAITDVVGVTKAYVSRVGSGVFATEFDDELSRGIRERGREYGTTTGRPRRIGWLDMVVLRHAKRVSGLNSLSVMLLDVLSGIKTLKICIAYELDGKPIDHIPASYAEYARIQPVYVELPGWDEIITNVHAFHELPKQAQAYLKAIEAYSGIPIGIFSVGPDRTQTIALQTYFEAQQK
jgi:adenylosuccinate synthase